ncbi:hypothetical protein [Tuwongella immobilis]|uniref:Uncharacterized protein n=1 Tax=Tuwongella immobilis TaxID=692036 RepID=A0A6C2YHY8_9BACT|nr:hypothetical protein [Tuwongella immobilis]VIP00881.1 unnamed protein product [Tuwongella immobilis]VTR97180.1 unnamed protein product [Tuwongella immobilis]
MKSPESIACQTIEAFLANAANPPQWPQPEWSGLPSELPTVIQDTLRDRESLPEWLAEQMSQRLHRLPSAIGELFLLVEGMEPTDGWLTVFAPTGEYLASGQFIGNRIGWGTPDDIRTSMTTGQRIPALQTAAWTTQADGSMISPCGQFRIAPRGKKWRLSQNGTTIQDWDTRENALAHGQALAMPPE